MHALQALGVALLDMSDDELAGLDLPERLVDAIHSARSMKSNEALRRQKQYIGKLMQDVDPAPINALLDRRRADDRREKRVFANAERWRDRLLREGHPALMEFEAEVGAVGDLERLLADLDRAVSDRTEKTLKREIFREIHRALAARAPDR